MTARESIIRKLNAYDKHFRKKALVAKYENDYNLSLRYLEAAIAYQTAGEVVKSFLPTKK